MGAWGEGALDNDRVADWMHELFEESGFADRVAAGLASGDPDVVRGAAWLIATLGRVYVWPIDRLDADRGRARRALEALLTDEDWLGTWADRARVVAQLTDDLAAIPAPDPAAAGEPDADEDVDDDATPEHPDDFGPDDPGPEPDR